MALEDNIRLFDSMVASHNPNIDPPLSWVADVRWHKRRKQMMAVANKVIRVLPPDSPERRAYRRYALACLNKCHLSNQRRAGRVFGKLENDVTRQIMEERARLIGHGVIASDGE